MALMAPLKSLSFAHGSEWYEISDEYDSSIERFSGDYEYFGYLNIAGGWIIQRHQILTGAYRYVQGKDNYTAMWDTAIAGRISTYGLYSTLGITNP
jgi:hypothetical protein